MTDPTEPSTEAISTTAPATFSNEPIVARAGKYYRNTRYLMAALMIGMACWFLHDGAVKWPAENKIVTQLDADERAASARGDDTEKSRLAAEKMKHVLHSDWDIRFQWILGLGLPPLGILLLVWALRNSRGEIKMVGDMLSVPGHPDVTLANIQSVNNSLWDRKGIAWVSYELSNGQSGEIRLDDFVYERPPIDAIYDRIAEFKGLKDADEEDADEESDEVTPPTEDDTRI